MAKMIRKYIYLFPVLILIVSIANLILQVSFTDMVFGIKQYLGLLFTLVSIFLSIINRKYGLLAVGFTLIAGAMNYIAFTAKIVTYSIGFKLNNGLSLNLRIQVFSLLILILFLAINRKILIRKFSKKDI